jgi:uncharacterized membrane protein YccC
MTAVKQVIRNIIAALLALGFYSILPGSQGYWIVIATLLALQVSNHSLLRRKIIFLVTLGLLTAALTFIANIIAKPVFVLAFFLALMVFSSILVAARDTRYWSAAFLVSFSVLLSAGLPVDIDVSGERFFYILLGFVIAILLQFLPFAHRLLPDVKRSVADCLDNLGQLTQAIFSCYTTTAYTEQLYMSEKLLHDQRIEFLQAMSQARLLAGQLVGRDRESFATILLTLEHVYEIILALGSLLYRVNDHSTFAVASQELINIAQSIATSLQVLSEGLAGQQSPDLAEIPLLEKIQQFEEVNQSALQVVAHEPIVFMLFIHDLTALYAAIQLLAESLVMVKHYE